MSHVDPRALAQELLAAYSTCTTIAVPPSARGIGFDMTDAYAVEAEVVRVRRERGRTTVGRKVGFANKAMWRVLKLDTLVWAHMYDDTVRYATENNESLPLTGRCSPRIEPEIVFKLRMPVEPAGTGDVNAVLAAVEWIALGFEINDCVFPDWKFQPADFVAAFGFHVALVVGTPRRVDAQPIPSLVEQLPKFPLRLLKNGQLVEEGSGRNSLRSPALCLGELAAAIARQPGTEPLDAGELVSTGTLTNPHPVAAGDTWRAEVDGLDLPALTVRF
jgi:2-keto-4-pentenoate hydratase